jgi:hypothetical protein
MCIASQAQTLLINTSPHPQKYNLKHAVLPASLAFAAGASWGFHETSVNWPDRIPIPGISSFGMAGSVGATSTRTGIHGSSLKNWSLNFGVQQLFWRGLPIQSTSLRLRTVGHNWEQV